nr:accessory protein [Meliandou uranomys virus]
MNDSNTRINWIKWHLLIQILISLIMAFKLSNLFKAIGMKSKKHTVEVQFQNQEQKKEQQPGKLISRTRIMMPEDKEGEERAKKAVMRAAARMAMDIMDKTSEPGSYQNLRPGTPPVVEITREGMIRILLSSMSEQGKEVDEKAMELVEEGVLNARELMALKEAIPLARLMITIMIGSVY